ncbi:alpha/beta hydrolase [Mycolicibacterium goodii]|uniref:alpha/beta hydrolase n=1 Tax=Mycolicibacterium goodii TaxID=134601 RepID=UPI0013045A47|nr:alpha/beta hydrolase [Mycolicibacterium goodii]
MKPVERTGEAAGTAVSPVTVTVEPAAGSSIAAPRSTEPAVAGTRGTSVGRRGRWRGLALRMATATAVSVLAVGLCSCSHDQPVTESPETYQPGELLSAPLEFQGYPALDALAATSLKIRYRSTSGIDGTATTVSGVVFVPKGQPPAQGWPIASIAHATAGITSDCAPSAYPNLLGNLAQVVAFLSQAYVVVVSDYQGLGTPGPHPYLEPKTAAYNVIDAVRAARHAVPHTSTTWITYGFSQGGQAAWAANEMATEYAPELTLAAAVSVAPSTDLRPFADAIDNGTLTTDQIVLLPLVLKGLQAAHPELNLDDYLHGILAKRTDVFFACAGVNDDLKGLIAKTATPNDYKPTTQQATDNLRTWLAQYSLPMRPTTAPMLVAYGDQDTIVLPTWTTQGLQQACNLGDTIDIHAIQGQGHYLQLETNPADWVSAVRSGEAPVNSCTAT